MPSECHFLVVDELSSSVQSNRLFRTGQVTAAQRRVWSRLSMPINAAPGDINLPNGNFLYKIACLYF
jgi:hypothetical protein